MNFAELENKIDNTDGSYFVVRDTDHPVEDLERNWSTFCGGVHPNLGDFAYDTEDQAKQAEIDFYGKVESEFRFHPAHNGFCVVHYEGLGAFELESEVLEIAIKEAKEYEDDLACTTESGNGHFFANQVLSFHKVRDGRYIFQIS